MDSYSLLFVGLLTFPVATLSASAFDSGAQHVRLRDTPFCIDVPSGSDVSGPVPLQLWDCVDRNTNQAWLHTSSSRAPGNPIVISSDTQRGKYIGITGDGAHNGGAVQLVPCEEKLTVWTNSPYSLCLWENRVRTPDLCIGFDEPAAGADLTLKHTEAPQSWSLYDSMS